MDDYYEWLQHSQKMLAVEGTDICLKVRACGECPFRQPSEYDGAVVFCSAKGLDHPVKIGRYRADPRPICPLPEVPANDPRPTY